MLLALDVSLMHMYIHVAVFFFHQHCFISVSYDRPDSFISVSYAVSDQVSGVVSYTCFMQLVSYQVSYTSGDIVSDQRVENCFRPLFQGSARQWMNGQWIAASRAKTNVVDLVCYL